MSDHDYSLVDRMLHRIALGNDAIPSVLFDMEKLRLSADRGQIANGTPVFVCGLARAGTTFLMRQFHATGQFRSLTYRDMPFVTAPNLWRRFSGSFRKMHREAERAHGDGMQVGFDSPEALEEVFWRVQYGEEYILEDRLVAVPVDQAVCDAFLDYVAIILSQEQGARYLSKNNNNILRLDALRRSFRNALIIVPFRDPVQQAMSLHAQHRHFAAMQSEDPFVLNYMNWLVHHEFGLGHRPFVFSSAGGEGGQTRYSTNQPEYWLAQWRNAYSHLLASTDKSVRFVSYEAICEAPDRVFGSLFEEAGLPFVPGSVPVSPSLKPEPGMADQTLVEECKTLYLKLQHREQASMAC